MGFGCALCVRSGRLEEFLNFSAGESAIDGPQLFVLLSLGDLLPRCLDSGWRRLDPAGLDYCHTGLCCSLPNLFVLGQSHGVCHR
jgi:hypothetical protein